MLKQLPNALTLLRLLLAFPVGLLILREQYGPALVLGFIAGLTDAIDGLLARRLQAFSRFGAIIDPLADKLLVTIIFLALAQTGIIPWYLALLVIARDVIIVAGATCYRLLIGRLDMEPSVLSKANMFVQVSFCVIALLSQLTPGFPPAGLVLGEYAVLLLALASGADYVLTWAVKARRDYAAQQTTYPPEK
jgi:cardiolipin synthase